MWIMSWQELPRGLPTMLRLVRLSMLRPSFHLARRLSSGQVSFLDSGLCRLRSATAFINFMLGDIGSPQYSQTWLLF